MEYHLYNGDIVIEKSERKNYHLFKIKGQKNSLISVTSATGIIDKSKFLIPWAVRLAKDHIINYLNNANEGMVSKYELFPIVEEAAIQHTKVSDTAKSIGTQVHNFCEQFSKDKLENKETTTIQRLEEFNEEDKGKILNGINAFLGWYNKNNVKFIKVENIVYSRKYNYVGIFDCLAEINGKHVIIDYKTGKGIYNENYYQLAAYKAAFEEEIGGKIEKAIIIHFNKETGEFNVYEDDNSKENFKIFLACLTIKKREQELNK